MSRNAFSPIIAVLAAGFLSVARSDAQSAPPVRSTEGASAAANAMRVVVHAPAGADVVFDGVAAEGHGTTRLFEAVNLLPGRTYTFDIYARWKEGERKVHKAKIVGGQAGETIHVYFAATGLGATSAGRDLARRYELAGRSLNPAPPVRARALDTGVVPVVGDSGGSVRPAIAP
jgi:uncharacterized protein (TIGR03000 family)